MTISGVRALSCGGVLVFAVACGADDGEAPTSGAEFESPIKSAQTVAEWTDDQREEFCSATLSYLTSDPYIWSFLRHVGGDRTDDCEKTVSTWPAPPEGYVSKCFINDAAASCNRTATELATCVNAEARRLRSASANCGEALEDFLAGSTQECVRIGCGFVPIAFD